MPKTLELKKEIEKVIWESDLSDGESRLLLESIMVIIQARDTELVDSIMGTVVKNSEGFDTYSITGKQLYHLDIQKFEEDLSNLLNN